ncbi:hypothetical protein SCFA_4010004 [anaerobic digester metagenome]|uniref:Uncharacterized protein n=1 Tax=anaerobic digester metagenome TaxID=1263854 RepID=A0A485M4G5_9ZZZZ
MKKQLTILQLLNLAADEFYEEAKHMGRLANHALSTKGRSQMKGLERVANSLVKVSDIFDNVKKQTARHEEWQTDNFGQQLLTFLEQDLRTRTEDIVKQAQEAIRESETDQHPTEITALDKQEIYIRLCQEYVRQLVVHYEYALAEGGGNHAE